MNQLEKDYKYCHKLMKMHSKSFSYAFDFLEMRKRKAVWVVYAVCRIIDDSIDRDKDINHLLKIKSDLESIYDGSSKNFESDSAIMRAFEDNLKHYNIPYEPLKVLIDYVKEDLHLSNMQTDKDLFNYCYGVAGTVGELLTPILATRAGENYAYARTAGIELGKALQITNILRDVGEDFNNNRIYLSKEKMGEYEVDLSLIYKEGVNSNYINLWESYAQKAYKFYENSLNNMKYFDDEVQHIIKLAANIYIEILEEVRKENYTLHKKVYVSKTKKLKIYNELVSFSNRSEK